MNERLGVFGLGRMGWALAARLAGQDLSTVVPYSFENVAKART